MLRFENIQFSYGRKLLFDDLNLQIQKGHIYGLLGLNGAGKSTILKLIAGLQFHSSGNMEVLGSDPAKRNPDFLSKIFMLPEEFYVPHITVNEFLATRTSFYPLFDQKHLDKCLEAFEVPVDKRLNTLSFGQKKKFFISLGLSLGTELLIMDEPTNGLDIPSKGIFRKMVAEAINDNRTFIISSHQVKDLDTLLNFVSILHEGQILFSHSIDDVMDKMHMELTLQPPEPDAANLIYSQQVVGGYSSLWMGSDSTNKQIDLEVLFNAVISNPHVMKITDEDQRGVR